MAPSVPTAHFFLAALLATTPACGPMGSSGSGGSDAPTLTATTVVTAGTGATGATGVAGATGATGATGASGAADNADDADDAAQAPAFPAPWDDGWPREWFYPHPRPADDARWERIARPVGHPAPALVGLDQWLQGGPLELDELRGKIVVLDFWATWCPDCAASVPELKATARRLADEPVAFVQVCAPKGSDRYADAVERWRIEGPVARDAEGLTEEAYDVPRWPYYVLIDGRGRVRAAGLKTAALDEALDLLLEREAWRDD